MFSTIPFFIISTSTGIGPTPTFPCTIIEGQTYIVSVDTTTNCNPLTIDNGGTLTINTDKNLTQNNP